MIELGKIEDLWDDDEDFSYHDDWLNDIDNIRSIVFDLAKSFNFVKVYLYGEYTHPLTYERKDKVVRIAIQSDNIIPLKEWDILENALSEYPVVFTDYNYLISGNAKTGAQPDDLTMFQFGNWIMYSKELKSKEDLSYIPCERELTEHEMRTICAIK
ncbi:TPA: hypothetical protein U1V53_001114 [Streptococcus suis]|nr:hypothetical protein [Streptococcus suis]HEM3949437.1 hypothetical protein [Streptococcus suis]HEM3955452.1 hypothetical protein [Streptococcus suis]